METHKESIEIQYNIICDKINNILRPIVPVQYRRTIFDLIHNISHPGIKATRKLLTQRFTRTNINTDCNDWAKTCEACQKSKVKIHTKTPLSTFETPVRRFDDIHVDIVGPLPISQDKQYLFTIIDRFTRWPDAMPMKNITTSSCCKALLKWVSKFGVPINITSDRGRQFISRLWNELTNMLKYEEYYIIPSAMGPLKDFIYS